VIESVHPSCRATTFVGAAGDPAAWAGVAAKKERSRARRRETLRVFVRMEKGIRIRRGGKPTIVGSVGSSHRGRGLRSPPLWANSHGRESL
jgi:hypothetical protein